uniref:Uncharacterized protein n=1 Tax=Plectus sambesii TaxID=2011161 RepID=A0A914X858_9BILA
MTSSVVASDRMGGKQEPTQSNQTSKAGQMAATQEQLRLARITQEASKDEDQAIIQKAIRKVIEATRCSQSAAEIALYDADNDVGTAIMAVLDQPPVRSPVSQNNAIVTSLLNQQPTSETFRSTVAPSPPRNPGNATSWTQQLKNDLGIGRAPVSSVPSQAGASRQTVEFVSDDGRDDSSALPEYQFGFHVEAPSVTPQQQQQQQSHDYSSTSASVDAVLFPTRTSKSDAVLDSVRGPANFSQTSTAVNGSMSKDNSKNTAASIQSSYGSMQMPSVTAVATAPKAMSMGQSTASIQPTLAYADTTTISYPDASRGVYAMNNQQFATSQAVTSTYSQSSNKNSTTTTSKAPLANPMFNTNVQQMYNPTFPYMNLYSPVTTVRPDDPQQQFAAAALLQQYPFMPQMDLSSMLPPVVASGAQQQSRNDQSNNYADVLGDYNKTYNAGRGDTQTSVSSNVAPPPGFSGPPSNVAAAAAAQAAFGIPQGNFTSLFQNPMLPPTYHHQMPLSFMLPNMAGNGQNPVNLQQKLTQPQMFTQSTFDDQNQANQQQQDYGRSAQSGPIQSFSQQQQQQGNKGGSAGYANAGNDSKSVYGGGSHGQLSKGTFERSNYTTTATATPPPNQMSGLNQYAPPVAFNPNAHMTGFAANAGYGSAQLQQLSPMAMPGAHMHDARASGQQSGVKHGGTMQQSKYAGQTGSYGTWA